MTNTTENQRVTLEELRLRYIQAPGKAFSDNYRAKLLETTKSVEKFAKGTVFADQFCDDLLMKWLEYLIGQKRTAPTIRKRRQRLVTLWIYAHRLGLVQTHPFDNRVWRNLIGIFEAKRRKERQRKTREPVEGELRYFFRNSFKPMKLRSRAEDTIRLYETTLNTLRRFLGREALMTDLTDETISRFLSWFTKQPGGRSKFSANKERSNVLAIWRFACRKRVVEQWPDVETEKVPKRIPHAWKRDQLATLFAAFQKQTARIAGVPAAEWWTAIHYVIWDTGERISAVMAIRWDWIDFQTGTIIVPAEARKGSREDRRYQLHQDTIAILQAIRQPPRELVFAWDRSRTYVYNRYKKILKDAGLPHDSKSKFHCMRRSVASHGKVAGLDPQQLMGHADARVTAAYLDPSITGQSAGGSTLFRPFDISTTAEDGGR